MKTICRHVERLVPYVPGEQPRSRHVIKLNTNENPYPPSQAVARALAALDVEELRRYPDPVSTELRRAIAELHGCAVEQVFVGNGSDEVLALCTRAFVENDGRIGYFVPSYSLYPVLAGVRGVAHQGVGLNEDFEWVDPRGPDWSLFFVANPNAPTGTLFPGECVASFAGSCRGVVVIDEAYVDFAPRDCIDLALGLPNVLATRTLSKSYSLAGLRLGYAVGSSELVEALFKIKDSYNVDAVSQAVALAAIRDCDGMRAAAGRICATRQRLSEGLAALGFRVYPSGANFVWTRPVGAADVLFAALKQRGILVRHFSGARTGAFLRITVGTDTQVDALLETVRDLCQRGTSHEET